MCTRKKKTRFCVIVLAEDFEIIFIHFSDVLLENVILFLPLLPNTSWIPYRTSHIMPSSGFHSVYTGESGSYKLDTILIWSEAILCCEHWMKIGMQIKTNVDWPDHANIRGRNKIEGFRANVHGVYFVCLKDIEHGVLFEWINIINICPLLVHAVIHLWFLNTFGSNSRFLNINSGYSYEKFVSSDSYQVLQLFLNFQLEKNLIYRGIWIRICPLCIMLAIMITCLWFVQYLTWTTQVFVLILSFIYTLFFLIDKLYRTYVPM